MTCIVASVPPCAASVTLVSVIRYVFPSPTSHDSTEFPGSASRTTQPPSVDTTFDSRPMPTEAACAVTGTVTSAKNTAAASRRPAGCDVSTDIRIVLRTGRACARGDTCDGWRRRQSTSARTVKDFLLKLLLK